MNDTRATTMDAREPRLPNLWRDEEGAVMVEFVIVLPFLLMIIFGIFLYMDLNRFLIASQQAAATQAWRGVAQGRSNFEPSDEIAATGLPLVGDIAGFATLRNAFRLAPMTAGDARAIGIYSIGGTPFDIQGMPRNTFDQRELDLAEMEIGGDLTYRNNDYITPFAAVANSYVGAQAQQDDYVEWDDVPYMARQSILHDTYSVHYANKGKRLRYADRFTIMRDPIYLPLGVTQTIISGNPGVLGDLGTILDDFGLPGGNVFGSGLSNALSILSLSEQAQPLRKLDKRMDERHDVDGKADFGEKEIPNNRRISTVSGGGDEKKMGE